MKMVKKTKHPITSVVVFASIQPITSGVMNGADLSPFINMK